jgi:SagB-type dehydrogenase family enzyme
MRSARTIAVLCVIALLLAATAMIIIAVRTFEGGGNVTILGDEGSIRLPEPRHTSRISVEEALLKRRSIREYKDEPLTLTEVSQLLWAAQGITDPAGLRTAPSAGALYPLEVYVAVGEVEGLAEGVYRYDPARHELIMVVTGDKRAELSAAALGQAWVREGAIVIVFSAVYERTTWKYNTPVHDERTGARYLRGIRYVHMEVGHAAQNVYLQAVSLGLGTVVIGAFDDRRIREIAGMAEDERPLYLMPVGRI